MSSRVSEFFARIQPAYLVAGLLISLGAVLVTSFCIVAVLFLKRGKRLPPGGGSRPTVDLSLRAQDFVGLANDVWKLNQRLRKIYPEIEQERRRGLESSGQRLRHFLSGYGIEYDDPVGRKYVDGMNVNVISFEEDASVQEAVISETHHPQVKRGSDVLKRAEIVVKTPVSKKEV